MPTNPKLPHRFRWLPSAMRYIRAVRRYCRKVERVHRVWPAVDGLGARRSDD